MSASEIGARPLHSLKRAAMGVVCACWRHTLAGEMDEVDAVTLAAIVSDPQFLHHQNQQHNPVSGEDFAAEIRACPVSAAHTEGCLGEHTQCVACPDANNLSVCVTEFGGASFCAACDAGIAVSARDIANSVTVPGLYEFRAQWLRATNDDRQERELEVAERALVLARIGA